MERHFIDCEEFKAHLTILNASVDVLNNLSINDETNNSKVQFFKPELEQYLDAVISVAKNFKKIKVYKY